MLMYRGLPLSEYNNPTLYWSKMGSLYGTIAFCVVGGLGIAIQYYKVKKQEEMTKEMVKAILINGGKIPPQFINNQYTQP